MFHRTELLLDQVEAFQRTGQWASALTLCEKVFRESWSEKRQQDLLEVILRLAFVFKAKGDREISEEHLLLALQIAEATADAPRAARAHNGLGVLYQSAGEVEAAESCFLRARAHISKGQDRLTAGDIEMNLGIVANIRGELDDALAHYESAYEDYEAIANRGRLARVLNNIGMLFTDLERYSEASDALERALHTAKSIADLQIEGIIHANRTELFIATGDFGKAQLSCDAALELAERLGEKTLKAEVFKYFGIIRRRSGDDGGAELYLRKAKSLAKEINSPLVEAEAARELSLVFRSQDRNKEALLLLNESHTLFSTLRAKHDEAEIAGRLEQLQADFLAVVTMWGESIEAKDRYTSGHCQRVADYACLIATEAGVDKTDMTWFRMGAFLHDVGKTEVPEDILNKAGRLTDHERAVIEQHTVAGDEILKPVQFPWDIRPMVRSHHERWDGRGYPDGLAREDIPFTARILKIADVYDALTTTRSYREPLSPIEAFRLMEEDEGAFEPALFEIFRNLLPSMASLFCD